MNSYHTQLQPGVQYSFIYFFAMFLDGGVGLVAGPLPNVHKALSFILVLQREGVMRFQQEASDCCKEAHEKSIMSQV